MKKKKGGGLKKWFKEDWVDISTGKPCGRKSASNHQKESILYVDQRQLQIK
jgi:hypothetical protein